MRTLLIIFLLLISVEARADWDKRDTSIEGTIIVLHIIDWGQTLNIAKHPEKYYEVNPLLGRHPSTDRVNIFFATTLIIFPTVSYLLPDNLRTYWQLLRFSVNATCVGYNYSAGIHATF